MGTEIISADGLDKRLLRVAAGKIGQLSAEELAEATNHQHTPAKALLRVKELLAGIDEFTLIEKQKLLLIEAKEMLDQIKIYATSIPNAQMMAQWVAALRFISETLEKTGRVLTDKESKLLEQNARIMIDAIDLAMYRALDKLRAVHPTLTEMEIREALKEALPSAVAEVEKYVGE